MLAVDESPTTEEEAQSQEGASPILVILRLLRGIYLWAVPTAVACGIVCALVGRTLVKPTYTSTGAIRVRPTLPRALVDNDENGELPMYESFVDMQATLLLSEKVADLAVQDPAWVAIAGPPSPDLAASMIGNLKVAHDGELVNVIYTSRNPNAAVVAVHAIISSYLKLYSETDDAAKQNHIEMIERVKATDNARLADLNRECVGIAGQFGSTNLDALIEFKLLELTEMKKNANQLDVALAAIQNGADPSTQPAMVEDNSAEIWALTDREMATLLDQKLQAEMTVRANRQVLGANNPTLRSNELAVRMLQEEIQDRARFLEKNAPPSARPMNGGGVSSLASLQNQKRTLDAETANAKAELAALGKANVRLKEITTEQVTLQQQLTESNRSLEELESENAGSGRIDVISYGDRAALQTSKRTLAAAGAGSMGALAALGCFLLLELRNRRLHQISDVQPVGPINLTILGALPIIPDRPVSYNEDVAYAVHKIRAHLQLNAARRDQRVLAMTSPLSGDGKTSMVVALGMSFAGSGSRTLLIDGDLVGGGLTARFDAKVQRNIAELVRRHTHVSDGELSYANEVCRSDKSELLEKLVELTFLKRDTATQISKLHEESNLGILDALAGDKLSDCVAATPWPNLFVLPRGAGTAEDVAYLSPREIGKLFQQARAAYDIVLVDTGPISGSIEATLIMSEADGTILVVSRGGAATNVRRAVNEVQTAGGVMLGVIFNRAKPKDMLISGFSSSVRSQAQLPSNGKSPALAGAVASALVRTSRSNSAKSLGKATRFD